MKTILKDLQKNLEQITNYNGLNLALLLTRVVVVVLYSGRLFHD